MIYIWGLGFFYKINEFRLKEFEIAGYIDNKKALEMSEYKGKPLIKSADINSNMTVLVMSKNFVSMVYELIEKKVKKIIIGTYIFPDSGQEELLKEHGEFIIKEKNLIFKTETDEICINNQEDLSKIYRRLHSDGGYLSSYLKLPIKPFCREFGYTEGTPVDRYYIDCFLDKYKEDIWGDVVEIADSTYTIKYGGEKVKHSYIMHVNGWGKNVIKGNLESGEGIEENKYDCAIITQTLMFIYDFSSVVNNIYKMLKPEGVALITVAGISQLAREDAGNWGSYWSFEPDSLRKGFEKKFINNVVIQSYGNVKVAVAMLYGMCSEEIPKEIYGYNDEQYPLIIGVRVKKEKL